MTWYHATTESGWKNIQAEGVLWGIRNAPSRCTYLARSIVDAQKYGTILLEVEWDPADGVNNYTDGCWQMREYNPIPICNIREVGGTDIDTVSQSRA